MPDKLTDAEIKRALEEHYRQTDKGYSDYLAYGGKGDEHEEKYLYMLRDTLDLINRLQKQVEKCEKVERLADKTIATLQAENERLKLLNASLTDSCEGYIKAVNKYRAKNELLQAKIEGVQEANAILREYNETAKAEAYKEFAEKVKEYLKANGFMFCSNVDNLLNELVGE